MGFIKDKDHNNLIDPSKDAGEKPKLHLAVKKGEIAGVVEELQRLDDLGIFDCSSFISARDGAGQTALHLAVQSGRTDIVELILDKVSQKASFIAHELISLQDSAGQTALHIAAGKGYGGISNLLIKAMAIEGILKVESNNNTALHLAVQSGKTDIVELILDRASKTALPIVRELTSIQDAAGQTALHWAAYTRNGEAAKLLIGAMDPMDICKTTEREKWTALHMAVYYKKNDIVNLILEKASGAANIANNDNHTPLHLAIYVQNIDAAKSLVEVMDSESICKITEDGDRWTALHLAFYNKNNDLAEQILNKLSYEQASIRDKNKRDPLDWAKLGKNMEASDLFKAHFPDQMKLSSASASLEDASADPSPSSLEELQDLPVAGATSEDAEPQ